MTRTTEKKSKGGKPKATIIPFPTRLDKIERDIKWILVLLIIILITVLFTRIVIYTTSS